VVRFTRDGSDLYAHFLEWPTKEIRLDGLGRNEELGGTGGPQQAAGLTVELLGYDGTIEWREEDGDLIVAPPVMSPSQVPSPYAFVFKIGGALPPSQP
jgi:hypothetical protein